MSEPIDSNRLSAIYHAAEKDPELLKKLEGIVAGVDSAEPIPPEAFAFPPRFVILGGVTSTQRQAQEPVRVSNGHEVVHATYLGRCGPAHWVRYDGEKLVAHDSQHAWAAEIPYGQEKGDEAKASESEGENAS